MIFVTVGTFNFDKLILEIDEMISSGIITEEVVCQIGNGEYLPENCKYFTYTKDIAGYIDQADFVICHGGTGSTLGLIKSKKRFIAVANTDLSNDHQSEFLSGLCREVSIPWTNSIEKLGGLFLRRSEFIYDNDNSFFSNSLCADLNDYLTDI